jgi:carboxymethylproline synthase
MIILHEIVDDVLVLTFNHPKPQNPFSMEMQAALLEHLATVNGDDRIRSVVLYGGAGRSFSAGGDFSEILQITDETLIARLLGNIVDFYIALLRIDKPLIAAVDKYAIGMGFQVALTTDYRVGTEETVFIMPELKNGVACTLGGLMTEFIFGRFAMHHFCYGCGKIDARESLAWRLLNEAVSPDQLLRRAIEKAAYYGQFPDKAFRGTKRVNNARFIQALENVKQDTMEVHVDVIKSDQHRRHMENVLKINTRNDNSI